MVDALAVWAEEGRVLERDIDDQPLNRRYESSVSEWGNPLNSNIEDPVARQGGDPGNWNI